MAHFAQEANNFGPRKAQMTPLGAPPLHVSSTYPIMDRLQIDTQKSGDVPRCKVVAGPFNGFGLRSADDSGSSVWQWTPRAYVLVVEV